MEIVKKQELGEVTLMKPAIFTLLVIAICSTPSFAKYSGGSGTEAEPYQIGTVSDWNDLMHTASDWDANFVMAADVNLQGVPLIPVGNDLNGTYIYFTGVFDGNGHVVRNAAINMPGYWHIALFGIISSDSQIRNLGVEDVNMNGARDVAGLAGASGYGTTISNCYVTGKVGQYSVGSSHSCLGGLVGLNCGTITGSHAACDVNGNETKIGGLVGRNIGKIIDSYADVTVYGGRYVGGLVGENSYLYDEMGGGYDPDSIGTILRCYAKGSVTGNQDVGGLVGVNGDLELGGLPILPITDCYAIAAVKGGAGLVGFNYSGGGRPPNNFISISNCYAAGKVNANGGGLTGSPSMALSNCFWDINTTGQTNSGGGTGKTTTQMQTQSTFTGAGWDFNDVWRICEGFDYPRLSALGKYSGGSGNSGDPYQIATPCDLLAMANDVNDYNKCFILTADIDLDPCLAGGEVFSTAVIASGIVDGTGYNFTGNAFTGVFDGAGHKIINLAIDANVNSNYFLGLFGNVNGGEVKNLGLEDVEIISSENFSSFCGGIAGRLENGVISNCYSSGNVTTGAISWLIGGLVGENRNSGSITNSHSTCNVTCADDSSEFGGFAGRNLGTINNCFSKGTVTGNGMTYGVGGLVGTGGGYIFNSFSTSNVTGGDNSFSVGGLAGSSDGVITDCFSTGSVTGGDYIAQLGGLAGMVGFGSISNCYSTGTVTGGVWANNIGGFAGALGEMSEPIISNCYSTGNVNGGNDASSLGGFIGQCQGDIINCYSTGNVYRTSGEYVMGGFAGSINFGGDILVSYYLVTAGPDNDLGIPLSDAQMKQQASFVGWDFSNVWAICEGTNYPRLIWQIPAADLVCSDGVNFVDYSFFAQRWLNTNCAANNDCDGTDFDSSGTVDIDDLKVFCGYWLQGI